MSSAMLAVMATTRHQNRMVEKSQEQQITKTLYLPEPKTSADLGPIMRHCKKGKLGVTKGKQKNSGG